MPIVTSTELFKKAYAGGYAKHMPADTPSALSTLTTWKLSRESLMQRQS